MGKRITPGQALLILMAHYHHDADKHAALLRLYVQGAQTPDQKQEFQNSLQDTVLNSYEITYDYHDINNDPTRRYFESHLAFETLIAHLKDIPFNDLNMHVQKISNLIPEEIMEIIQPILDGEVKPEHEDVENEYAGYIKAIKERELFTDLIPNDRKKMLLLVKSSFLAVIIANMVSIDLPIDIYGTGYYEESARGKILKSSQGKTESQHLGLLKGYMPLPSDDLLKKPSSYPNLKPSDQAAFKPTAAWVKLNFDEWVHPFSNGISGTILCQFRVMAKLMGTQESSLATSLENFRGYYRLIISSLLFYSGGHSFREFTAPFNIAEVQEAFKSIPGASDTSIETLFLNNNAKAVETALERTQSYFNVLMLKRAVLDALPQQSPIAARARKKTTTETQGTAVHRIDTQVGLYAKTIQQQFFSSRRLGTQKYKMVKPLLDEVKTAITKGDWEDAVKKLTNCKAEFIKKYGEKNFWKKPADEIILMDTILVDITRLKTDSHYQDISPVVPK